MDYSSSNLISRQTVQKSKAVISPLQFIFHCFHHFLVIFSSPFKRIKQVPGHTSETKIYQPGFGCRVVYTKLICDQKLLFFGAKPDHRLMQAEDGYMCDFYRALSSLHKTNPIIGVPKRDSLITISYKSFFSRVFLLSIHIICLRFLSFVLTT